MANEVRLIDANALEQFFLHESKRLRECLTELDDFDDKEEKDYILSFLPTVEWARKTVHHISTIDPESLRPKGRWIDPEWNDMWQSMTATCSHCLERGEVRVRTNEYGMKVINSPCCPNCGAKMMED